MNLFSHATFFCYTYSILIFFFFFLWKVKGRRVFVIDLKGERDLL